MNIAEVIGQMRARIVVINQVTSLLSSLDATLPVKSRRGRKSMGAAERLEVAARMRRYWINHRQVQQVEFAR